MARKEFLKIYCRNIYIVNNIINNMKETAYLIINKSGIKGVRKQKPSLNWDEISMKIDVDIPDVLFQRPHLQATVKVDKDKIQPNQICPEIILDTKELIEQQTGAKIDFKVVSFEEEKKDVQN